MTILFMEPLNKGWGRMKAALFRPFNLHKWFVVGFNAFLAGLMNASNGSSGARGQKDADFGEFIHFPQTAWDWLTSHPGWAVAIIFGILVAIAVIVVLTWISSRGVFMFLESVVRDRVEIAKPWREYQKEGDSLFVWRLVFGLITFVAFGALAAWFFIQGGAIYDRSFDRTVPILLIVGAVLLVLAVVLVIGYIMLFLQDFVAALMYKNRISAVAAWRLFLGLFRRYPFHFLAYGIVIFLLMLVFVAAVVVAGIVTCCIGWFVLVIPYIGTVATLPFWYTLRAFSLEFLAQFGPEYDVFPKPAAPAGPAVAAPAV
jgi:MFS family permease